ncbi:hypothetical protein [Azospirillum rugosum]|uniref:Uncharacterized protein n=1 Tax=Azospirillum rugosum TaxID=416170 RepID=A0ABS4SSD1_9PROT|nr:hypothetical protein [Azospirillum rugosum]MBP2295470.1 hypothetical protein [Azospirillum rugosum]MDQ0528349.1 hypothetical protein [Azospirillum rugosum]
MTPQPASVRNQRGSVLVTVMVFMTLLLLFAGTFVRHVLVSEEEEVDRLLADTRVYWAMMGHMNYMLSRAGFNGVCGGGAKSRAETSSNTNHSSPCGAAPDYGDNPPTPDPVTLVATSRSVGTIIGSLQDYLDSQDGAHAEIQTNGSLADPGFLRWYYPQNLTTSSQSLMAVNANTDARYWFDVRAVVSDRPRPGGATASEPDGQIRLDMEVGKLNTTGHVGGAGALRDLRDRIGRLTIGLCVVDSYQSGTDSSNKPVLFATTGTSSCIRGVTTVTDGAAAIQFIQRNFPF